MNEERFRWGWKTLCKLYKSKHNHCLKRGCGAWTLAVWVRYVCHVDEHPSFWKNVLTEATKRGWCEVSYQHGMKGCRKYKFLGA